MSLSSCAHWAVGDICLSLGNEHLFLFLIVLQIFFEKPFLPPASTLSSLAQCLVWVAQNTIEAMRQNMLTWASVNKSTPLTWESLEKDTFFSCSALYQNDKGGIMAAFYCTKGQATLQGLRMKSRLHQTGQREIGMLKPNLFDMLDQSQPDCCTPGIFSYMKYHFLSQSDFLTLLSKVTDSMMSLTSKTY